MERRIARDISPYLPQKPRPTLGHQKAVEQKKRGVREFVLLGIKITFAIVLCFLILAATIILRSHLVHSKRFSINVREIHGLRHIPETQVLERLKVFEDRSKSLLALDIDALRKNLELLPWAKTIVVRRVWPDRLIIEVVEKVPIAFARQDQSTWLVDDEGMILETRPDQLARFDFPVILGMESGFDADVISRNRRRIKMYRNFIDALDADAAGLSHDVSEIHLQDPENISVVLNEETVLVHLGSEQFQDRFRRYLAMSRDIRQKYPALDSVDLRFQNQVVINSTDQKLTSSSGH